MPINLLSAGGGTTTLTTASSASNFTVTIPAGTGTLVTTASLPPSGKVLQVVSTTKTDTFVGSTANNTFNDITGMSVNITPSSATSKILVVVFLYGGSYDGIEKAPWRLVRGATAICVGDAAGNRGQASGDNGGMGQFWTGFNGNMFLDSPATTSSTTYKCQYATAGNGQFWVNRTAADRNNSTAVDARSASTITVMEIAA